MARSATLDQPTKKEETTTKWTIYPDGTGAFACGSPDGLLLRHGQVLEVFLGDHWIPGVIEHHAHEAPRFIADNGKTACGLCACMKVRLPEWG